MVDTEPENTTAKLATVALEEKSKGLKPSYVSKKHVKRFVIVVSLAIYTLITVIF